MTKNGFVHLHVHSNFSAKDATAHPHELIKAAAFYEMPAVALTDHTTLAGAIRFYRSAQGSGVRPIIGTEIELASGHHLTLLAENMAGYSNLCRLLSELRLSQPGASRPLATWEILAPLADNLVCLSGCAHSRLSQDLLQGNPAAAREFLDRLAKVFPHSCYVELENPLVPQTPQLLQQLSELAKNLNLPLVATNNVHFLRRGDHPLRDLLVCMGTNINIRQPHPQRHQNDQRYFKGPRTMAKLFAAYPEALANTLEIAERCRLQLPLGSYHLPEFPLPAGETASHYLRQLCQQALDERYLHHPAAAQARLEHELQVIQQFGFCDYFLVVWDIVNFAKQAGIRCAGRGSAADSLVAYLLDITAVDPLAYDLHFERFLNPERKGMPDIDLDFASDRRDEVISYVYHKYSSRHVAMVGTVNTISARSALREVAKALDLNQQEVDRLARFWPRIAADRLETALASLPELQGELPQGEPWDTLLHFCQQLDSFPRHLSMHLAGLVISRQPLTDLVPLQWSAKGVVITQYDKDDLEYLGLVKMDLLGSRVLSAIAETLQRLRQDGVELCLEKLPLDDPAVYSLLRSTKTVGLFQLESPGMRELLGKLQPTCFSDIVANVSLMRPGPLRANMVTPFIRRRHGLEQVNYVHPSLQPILESTYGVIVYQEQVLQVASALAGFSLGQADLLRRLMTHERSTAEMADLATTFVAGATARGIDATTADRVFQQLATFASYGFNKAHAATLGVIGYYTAYLKAHYPAHFLVALLNHHPLGFYPAKVVLHEARLRDIPIHPLDINTSTADFTLENGGICVGFKVLQGLNDRQIAHIVAERQQRPFSSFTDFLRRVKLPRKTVHNLIKVGALRAFGSVSNLLQQLTINGQQTNQSVEQYALPLVSDTESQPTPSPQNESAIILSELELTGMYISGHPLEQFRSLLASYAAITSQQLRQCSDGHKVRVAGVIVSRQMPPTKSKQRVIFLTLEDEHGLIDLTVLPHTQTKYAKIALGCPLLLVEGTVRRSGPESINITAERLFDLRRLGKSLIRESLI